MTRKLKLLLVEDSEDDAVLLLRDLGKAGYEVDCQRVQSQAEMEKCLGSSSWDLVISDYSLPGFSGRKALDVYKAHGLDIPFIVISGAIGENMAVEMMKAGAHDYLMKGNFARLAPALERELHDAEVRQQRKKAVDQLRESEERWHFALEGSGDGVWDWDIVAKKVFFSHRWKEMLGYSEEEIKSTPDEWLSRIHPDDAVSLRRKVDDVVQGINTQFVAEYRMICKDASYKWILTRGKVISLTGRGLPQRVVGTNTDITDRKIEEEERIRLKDKLHQIEKYDTLGRLAGGIAHDFNNMLVPIIGYAELILATLEGESTLSERLKGILHAAEGARGLTQQILAFSRKQILQLKVLNLNDEIESIRKMMHRLIGEDITIETRMAADLLPVEADSSQIQQIIMNLVLNARDAMPEGGKLIISTSNINVDNLFAAQNPDMHEGQYSVMTITDTGTGIKPEIRERIFDPFFTTKEEGKGTGLGLATVYGIVKQHGGAITVYSEEGNGSTFSLYFPCVEGSPLKYDLPDICVEDFCGTESILIVEDSDSVRDLTKHMLEHFGYNVYHATGWEEALDVISREGKQIDLVIMDVVMPGLNGFDLYRKISVINPSIRVIFMSGYPENTVEYKGSEKNINFIQKPFSMHTLGGIVRRVLDGR